MTPTSLADHAARAAIATDLDHTLFVTAGAGSGKTTALIGRLEALVRSGVPLTSVAAITFTEKAASELRDRLRTRLAEQARSPDSTTSERERCRVALVDIDAAALSTLHAFAQRLLSEHPIEAGLPPGVEVLDEIGSDIDFDERWRGFVEHIIENPELESALLIARAMHVGLDHLRDIARAFDENWDLVAERVPSEAPPPRLDGLGNMVRDLRAVASRRTHCDDDTNRMAVALAELADLADAIEAADDPIEAFGLLFLAKDPPRYTRTGRRDDWTHPDHALDDVRNAAAELQRRRVEWCRDILQDALRQLASAIGGFTLAEADRRRREGRLDFHDLLVLARQLLRDPRHGHDVRRAAGDRYQRLLLDEFQDTDPIQIELAVLLTTPPAADDHQLAWHQLSPDPGRLFFVGDPKQSIYRFRRADIRLYLEAEEHFGHPPLSLVTNFRSTAGVLHWVNHVFSRVILPQPHSQPTYEPLVAARTDEPSGAAVTLLGAEPAPAGTRANELRHREAADVVAAIRTALADQWQVHDHTAPGGQRRAALGDICILLPARTSLPQLERALDNAGIPFRAEASSLLYGSAEVRDLQAILRAIDDPTDELALVTALRSAGFGCGDDDLYDFRRHHRGTWNHQAPVPDTVPAEHPVREGIEWLGALHGARTWLTPSEVLDRTLRERRLFELAFAQGRFRDLWRRYRFVLDQARAYGDAVGGSLREYLAWVDRQAAEGSRVSETVLPESDDDAVRILTVHASKGLEFPITIVSGLTTAVSGRRRGLRVVFPPDGTTYGLHVRKGISTDEFDLNRPLDEQMDHHERLRLLYVACTRAVDHLVVSCHRVASDKAPSPDKMMASELLFEASQAMAEWSPLGPSAAETAQLASPMTFDPIPDRATWADELAAAMSSATRPRVTSATAVARAGHDLIDPGVAKEPRDLDLPPWRRGRFGTAVGRAVHGVLQAVDLTEDDTAAIDALAASQAAAEGVDALVAVVAALARSALATSVVAEAAAAPHWKEVYVAAPVGDSLLEGYVDLVFERPDGLVVVDYKTDFVADDEHLADKLDRYRLQLGAYAVALTAATGRPVVEAVFVFCDTDGARTVTIDDLHTVALAAERVVHQGTGLDPVDVE